MGRPRKSTSCESLFDRWEDLREPLRAAKQIRVFLDFDGTLVGLRPRPEQVRLSAAARRALKKLAAHKRVRAAIVSGRARSDLSRHATIPGVALLGLYGWDRPKREPLPARTLRKIELARNALARVHKGLPGIRIEDKGVTLAVHFRGASPRERRLARSRVLRAMRWLRPELHVIGSSTTWEVVPKQIRGKGAALREVLGGVRAQYLPIYLGDDWTDEPAFAELRKGITVLVGPARKTEARYRVADSGEVTKFLRRLTAELD